MELDAGVFLGEFGDQIAKIARPGHRGEAEEHLSLVDGLARRRGLHQALVLADHPDGLFIKGHAQIRQVLALLEGVEKLEAHLLLQLVDDLAEGRLGDIQFSGGHGVISVLCHLDEIFQLPNIHCLSAP